MDTGLFEIQANLRQCEVRHAVVGRQRGAGLGPQGAPLLSACARRQVAALLGAALLTCALLIGGATVGTPNDGAGDGTPANMVVNM